MCLGSSSPEDAEPIIDLFKFITDDFGPGNELHTLIGTRLAVTRQIIMNHDELAMLYPKLQLSSGLTAVDFEKNRKLLENAYRLGYDLCTSPR